MVQLLQQPILRDAVLESRFAPTERNNAAKPARNEANFF
jgi:hypothetical protein